MKRHVVRFGIIALSAGFPALASVHAQRPVADARLEADAVASTVLARPVTIQLQNVDRQTVVKAIARSAGIRVQYQNALFDGVPSLLSVNIHNVPLKMAMEQALQGLPIRITVLDTDLIALKGIASDLQGILVGKIVHAKSRVPLSGVRILVGDATRGITTADDGTFRLVLVPGEHRITIRQVGFVPQVRTVQIADGATYTLDMELNPSTSVLDEVVVTGTVIATERKAIPTPITVIHGEELERRGITRIEQLFRGEVPGLLVLEEGTAAYSTADVGLGVRSTIYSRGSASLNGSANPIKTYVDGVELVDPSYLGTIDPRSIEKIEIITGPQAATIYGSGAMGGVMQIFTKRGNTTAAPEVQLSLKYGMLQNSFSDGLTPAHNDAVTVRGGASPELTYAGSLSYVYSGQWQPKLFSARYGASLGATHTRNRLTVSAAFSASSSRQGTWRSFFSSSYGLISLLPSPDGYNTGNISERMGSQQVSVSSNQTVSLNVDLQAAPNWTHHLTLGKSQNLMNLKPMAPNFSSNSGVGGDTLFLVRRLTGQRITWNYNTTYIHSWAAISSAMALGATGSLGDQLSVQGGAVSANANTIVGARETGGINASGPSVTIPMNDQNWGAFGTWRFGFFEQLYLTLGWRVEQNPRYGRQVKFDVTPTNGVTYTLDRGKISLKLMGSYGRATRPPPPEYREEVLDRNTTSIILDPAFWVSRFANPDLRPEYSRGPQGGLELYFGNLGSLTLNHYQQTITDLIQQVTVDSFERRNLSAGTVQWWPQHQYLNVAKIRQNGWEGTGAIQVGPAHVKGAYSWNGSKVISVHPMLSQSAVGRAFRKLPEHSANVTIGYAHGHTSLMLVTNYVGQVIRIYQDDRLYQQAQNGRLTMYGAIKSLSGLFDKTRAIPGYAKSDVIGSHRLTPQLTITANILNVGNRFQSDISDLNPSLGRQTTLGLSFKLPRR